MTTKRTKAIVYKLLTREEVESAVSAINALAAREQKVTAEMNAAIQATREPFHLDLKSIAADQLHLFGQLMAWAQANPDEFAKARSIQMPNGTLGYRLGNHQVKPLNKKWTFAKAIEALRSARLFKYLRTTVVRDINRDAILADRETLSAEKLAEFGLRIVQEETFYVEPAAKPVDPKIKEVA